MRFETERLILRPPQTADAPLLFDFLGDPEIMRHTYRRESVEDCQRYLVAHEKQRAPIGFAPWTVLNKADERIIGFGGLYDDPFDPGWGLEVAYFFARAAWGQGFALELTRFCLDHAGERGVAELSAFAHADNAASRRVLEKAGFEEKRFLPEMERYLYRWAA
ncbi:GNAT family N-acetyltransferase [Microvirga pudoricolor]|uniref:GNAT family N-acetyltransferase n=1 Tax=Microvirga pudoricolor TaxID=2778729 RepID=UPI00194F27AE|nr:GNAT family N-acetyltransferase [Microvirga pudoricolor]MBM6596102.1 GNAT family N-acetyltransferase [Microvirga pudoricolor]